MAVCMRDGASVVGEDLRTAESGSAHLLTLFEDRYGAGSHQRLVALLGQPCVTFAEIAGQFGVSRERVRQWHAQLMPAAPSGHRRQQLCRTQRHRRKLLEEPLFRTFYRNVRPHVPPGRIQPLPARDGFRTRSVTVDARAVAIRRARQAGPPDGAITAYRLDRYNGPADFVYYHLAGSDYLFLPATVIRRRGAVFRDEPASGYRRFKNTFDALKEISLSM